MAGLLLSRSCFPPDAHSEKGRISVLGTDWRRDARLSRARRVRVERARRLRRMKVTKVDYHPEAAGDFGRISSRIIAMKVMNQASRAM